MLRYLWLLIPLTIFAEPELNRRYISPSFIPRANEPIKIAFFDADSTLRISKSGSPSANGPKDFIVLPNVGEKIAQLNEQGYFVAIVSNQAGVPQYISAKDADAALYNLIKAVKIDGGVIHYFDFATEKNNDRKPDIGMGKRLETLLTQRFGDDRRVDIDWKNSVMVGDAAYKVGTLRPDGKPGRDFTDSDRIFAEKLGVKFIEANQFFEWDKAGIGRIDTPADIARYLTFRRCLTTLSKLALN